MTVNCSYKMSRSRNCLCSVSRRSLSMGVGMCLSLGATRSIGYAYLRLLIVAPAGSPGADTWWSAHMAPSDAVVIEVAKVNIRVFALPTLWATSIGVSHEGVRLFPGLMPTLTPA